MLGKIQQFQQVIK